MYTRALERCDSNGYCEVWMLSDFLGNSEVAFFLYTLYKKNATSEFPVQKKRNLGIS
jgi:hypothetical protein